MTSRDRPVFRIFLLVLVLGGLLSGVLLSAIVPVNAKRRLGEGSAMTVVAGATLLVASVLAAVVYVPRRLWRSLDTLLEDHAAERERELRRADAARDEADHANRTKDQFLAILGHELRNPLAPAFNALELMKTRDPVTFRREREILERSVGHMVQLVNDLMDVSRLARGKVQLRPTLFELRTAVDRAVDAARTLIEQHEHTLIVHVPRTGFLLNADQDRIVQVLRNLLTNAAKYTPAGGLIRVAAGMEDDRVYVACEDNGPGVAPELQPILFDSFAQGPRTLDRRLGGLGLGLTLARNLTELHGGTIAYESRDPEPGSRFLVRLPAASSVAHAVSAEPPIATENPLSLRLLVVDDNIDAVEVLREGLEGAGHLVEIALDGPSALEAASRFTPQVAILDIGLPGMDGYELARRLRRSSPVIRLIALTGYGQRSDVDAAMQAGFDAHCTKPVSLTTLLEEVERRSLVA